MYDAEVEVGREPRRAVHGGGVAVLGVARQQVVAEVPPAPPRGVLAGGRHALGGGGRGAVQQVGRLLVGVEGEEVGGARGGGRLRPAVLAPGPGEGREDLVGRARAVADQPGADGVRRTGGDQRHLAQRLRDARVAPAAVRRGLGRDVHGGRLDLGRHAGHHLDRVAVPDDQPPLEALVEGAQVRRQPGPPGIPGAVPQARVDDEQGQPRGRRRGRRAGRGCRARAGRAGTTSPRACPTT